MSERTCRPKPPKPYPTFPLFAHKKGYWAKRSNGRHVTFGRWDWPDREAYERSWRAALEKYHRHCEVVAQGRLATERPEAISIEFLVNAYLTHQHGRAVGKNPEISASHFCEIRKAAAKFRDFVGRSTTIEQLESINSARPGENLVVGYIEAQRERYGWHAFNKAMTLMGGMWTWAEHPIHGVLGRPFRLKPLFVKRAEKLRKREKRQREAERGRQLWNRDELAALLNFAPPILRTMLTLMYFCAYGNSDCSDLLVSAINFRPDPECGLPPGWALIKFPRPKTEVDRVAVVPPDVARELAEAIERRPKPAERAFADRVFLTVGGKPWVRDVVHESPNVPGQLHHTTTIDAVGQEFAKLRGRLARCPEHGWFAGGFTHGAGFRSDVHGVAPAARRPKAPTRCPVCDQSLTPMRKLGAYTFRHTAITLASAVGDEDARALFEGHAINGVRRNYVEEIEVPRLRVIAERLVARLWPNASLQSKTAACRS